MLRIIHPAWTTAWTKAWVAASVALMLTSCGETDPYAPFDRQPGAGDCTSSASWEQVRDGRALSATDAATGWQETLVTDILNLGPWPPADTTEAATLDAAWNGFTRFEGTRIAMGGIDTVLERSGALERARETLCGAFGRLAQHFPSAPQPRLDFAYTGFNYSAYPTDTLLVIGCEFFIGADHTAVQGLPPNIYPRYMQERMVPQHLAGDALRGWLLVHFQDEHYPAQGRLAEELLYWGKILFIARCLAPELAAHDLLDWTEAEWNWAHSHEMQVWMELRKEEFLYTSRRMDIQRWVADGPFTNAGAVPQDSPDRLGWYMGMRWVEDHMRQHPEMTLAALLEQEDVLPFLQTFRPRR